MTAMPSAPRSQGLGIAAVALSGIVLALSLAASVGIGLAVGQIALAGDIFFDVPGAFLLDEHEEIMLSWLAHVFLGTLGLACSAVLAIVAFAFDRGRPKAILAMVLSGVSPIVSAVLYVVIVLVTMQR